MKRTIPLVLWVLTACTGSHTVTTPTKDPFDAVGTAEANDASVAAQAEDRCKPVMFDAYMAAIDAGNAGPVADAIGSVSSPAFNPAWDALGEAERDPSMPSPSDDRVTWEFSVAGRAAYLACLNPDVVFVVTGQRISPTSTGATATSTVG